QLQLHRLQQPVRHRAGAVLHDLLPQHAQPLRDAALPGGLRMSEHSLGQFQPAEPAADEPTPLGATSLERTGLLDMAISQSVLSVRHARGRRWQALFNAATVIGLVALIVLGLTVVNEAFGLI